MSQPGRRIVVVGTSGSGKTYVAKALAERLGIEYVCNDAIIWGPDWTEVPRADRPSIFDAATRGEAWAFDGNILSLKDPEDRMILDRADTVVWLDLPRRTVYRQVVWRTFKRALFREELWHGNRESWRMSFASRDSIIVWSISSYPHYKVQCQRFFDDPQWERLKRIRLCSRPEVERWLRGVRAASH